MDITAQRQALRHSMRSQRQPLSNRTTLAAGAAIARRLATRIAAHHNVGLYWSAFGEVNTAPIIAMLWRKRCQVWLPVINPYNHTLYWRNYTPQLAANGRKHRHKLGMQQAHTGKRCRTAQLDTVLLPLLAIDKQGNRLGQGGGYYDRTLAKLPRYAPRPHSIGLAYPWQIVEHIPTHQWDVPLDAYCSSYGYCKASNSMPCSFNNTNAR